MKLIGSLGRQTATLWSGCAVELKICDPAMGSGHFLVSLVDYLADRVITAMAETHAIVTFGDYVSPLIPRIAAIRNTITRNAEERGWIIDPEQLDDRHIIRRIVLKRLSLSQMSSGW